MALKFDIKTPEEKQRSSSLKIYLFYAVVIGIAVWLGWGAFTNLILDTTSPTILITSPETGTSVHSKNLSLTFTVVDESNLDSCVLYVNSAKNSNFSAKRIEVQKMEVILDKVGEQTLSIECVDSSMSSNKGSSSVIYFTYAEPMNVEGFIRVDAPNLTEGLLSVYTGTEKGNRGTEVMQVLPRDAGTKLVSQFEKGNVMIGYWGKTNLKEQTINVLTDKETKSIYLPNLSGITTTLILYVGADGSTYHSFSNHNYNTSTNGDIINPDLSWEEALTSKHLARATPLTGIY